MLRWVVLAAVLWAGVAQAQEMKCNQVFMNPSEKAVCASPELLAIDAQMAQAYQEAKPHLDGIRKDQRAFKRERKACKGDMACLLRVYETQIAELRAAVPPADAPAAEEAPVDPYGASEPAMPGVVADVAQMDPAQPERPQDFASSSEDPAPVPPTKKDTSFSWGPLVITLLVIIVLIASFFSWLWKEVRRCPECGKWWGEEIDRAEQVGTAYETVTRTDKRRNRSGIVIDTVERQEQVAYNVVNAAVQLRCVRCKHTWIQHHRRRA